MRDLDEILEGHAATSGGRWRVGAKVGRTIYSNAGPDDLIGVMDYRGDATFVAHSHTDVPEMGTEIKRLRERVDSLYGAIQHGDARHRSWLRSAIVAHFKGLPIPLVL